MKLTEAQMAMLGLLARYHSIYPRGARQRTARVLERHGLINVAGLGDYGFGYFITPAGCAALEDQSR